MQTPSPWAMVASRWTWVPSRRGEDLGLGLAQLGELLGHVRDRAVVLAELLTRGRAAVPAGRSGGSVAVGGERAGQRLGALAGWRGVDERAGSAPRAR